MTSAPGGGLVIAGDKANGQLTHVNTRDYEMSFRRPDGKFERARFSAESSYAAKRRFKAWTEEQRQRFAEKARKEAVPLASQERKAASVCVYVVSVGAKLVCYTATEGEAFAIASALEDAAAASGFKAAYEVSAVKRFGA